MVGVHTAPCQSALRECAAKQRPCDTGNAEACAEQALQQRPLVQRHCVHHDQNGTSKDAAASKTCDRSTNNQHNAVLRRTADCASNLEQEDTRQERWFRWEVGVDTAVQEDEAAGCKHVRRRVPADICHTVELVCYGRNGGS